MAKPPISKKAVVYRLAAPLIRRDLLECAPRFAAAVASALVACRDDRLDVTINEAVRTDQLQRLYYTLGRNAAGLIVDKRSVVTYAKSALYSWHGYGLAVDVKSRALGFEYSEDWITAVARHFKAHGLDWGGLWKRPDFPHFQFGRLKPSPSDRARELYRTGGLDAVWREVRAA